MPSPSRRSHARRAAAAVAFALLACRPAAPPSTSVTPDADGAGGRWYRGNLHTHSLWSDGNDFPEMVLAWYRDAGYDFVALTDHNVLPDTARWVPVRGELRGELHRRYVERFGDEWVDERQRGDTLQVRLRTLAEYGPRLARPGFLLLPGEEITQYLGRQAIHVNAVNVAAVIPEQKGATAQEVLQRDIDAVAAQRRATGQPMLASINHPNFVWSLTAADLAAVRGARFFELYNGHPLVNSAGDRWHPGTERLWDIVLAERLSRGGEPLYGIATDDAHDYHATEPHLRNPGRGWVMVRADTLTPAALVEAMERGDFYASTGVALDDVRHADGRLTVRVRAEPGVQYVTRFVGTRRDWDRTTTPQQDSLGAPVTPRHSEDVGALLAEVAGPVASYALRGDELYVRAVVTSTKPKGNVPEQGEVERAWTQPVVVTARP